MALQWPLPDVYLDGDFTVATPVGIPESVSPIPATTLGYVFTQKFWQFRANFFPGTLNTQHPSAGKTPDFSNYFLVAEGKRKDIGMGVVEWERTYAIKPAAHNETESFNYNFIGYLGQIYKGTNYSGISVGGRPRRNFMVDSRVLHEYFIIGITDSVAAAAAGQVQADFSDSELIPVNYGLRYFRTDPLSLGVETDLITDPVTVTDPTLGPITVSTSPSRTDYSYWLGNGNPPLWIQGNSSAPQSYALGAVVTFDPGTGPAFYIAKTAISVSGAAFSPLNPAYWAPYTHGGMLSDPVNARQWKGPWTGGSSPAACYSFGDQVIYLGVVYQCIALTGANGTAGQPNVTIGTIWKIIFPGQFVAEDSRISRWMGNIWLRQTRYILPR